jgi:uncharacterized protein
MSADYIKPGVNISEIDGGPRSISGVATSVTAFIGAACMGPMKSAALVSSFADFESQFGGLSADSELGYAVRQFFLNGGIQAWVARVTDASSEAELLQGIQCLDTVDLFDLLVLPGVADPIVLTAAADYCQRRRAFFIADAPQDAKTPAQMLQRIQSSALPRSSYASVYYPWLQISDPLPGGHLRIHPPSGTVAGVFARIDSTRGVWKAPAGNEADLRGLNGLEYNLSDGENGLLNPHGVNCLRAFSNHSPVVWGSRTLDGDDARGSEFKYIPVRRTALFIEESVYRGTQWVAFEPNNEHLWVEIRRHIDDFMIGLFRQGAFQGRTPRDAYFVKCDAETTTQINIDLGVVNIIVGFAPLRPAEFVLISIQIRSAQPTP